MIRDLVAGVLCGGLVSAVGLGVVSQIAPGPQAGAPPVLAGQSPGQSTGQSTGQTAAPPAKPEPPKPEVQPSVRAAAPAAAPQPKVTAEPGTPQAAAPVAPPAPGATAAPEPQAPGLPASGGAAPPAQAADKAPAPVAQAPTNPPPATAPVSPIVPTAPAPAPLPTAEVPPPDAGKPADRLLEPGAEPTPGPSPANVAPVPAPKPQPAAPQPAAPATAPAAAETAKPKLLQPDVATKLDPAPGLPKSADGVTVGRLPTIGAQPDAPADAKTTPPAKGQVADLPPLQRYAAKFANPSGKPLFALILTDDGSPQLDRAKLAALPFPVTFAIDPLAPNAAQAAATYRAGGKEVLMLASGLPSGATAADVEQSLQAMTAVLPETVGMIDLAAKGFQDDRALASQIVTILKADGRGLITYDRGLNAADQVARRDDLPAAMVFRDLDGQGEEVPMIRRYLDRAAFKAAQEGRVAVVGTTRPETVAAIMEWSIEGRASSVTLAPASAVMAVQ